MVVPVPVVLQKENVKTLPADVFDRVDSLSAPRLVEYWEQDPCRAADAAADAGAARRRRWSSEDAAPRQEARERPGRQGRGAFVAGEYEIVILSARDSSGLETWLRQEKYNIPQGAAAALAPYIRDKSKFFVAKVDIKKVKRDAQGVVQLSPLRFHFDANELRLPVRLGLLNAAGKQDLIVYIIHPTSRFEVANYANTFIPTNLEVADGVRNNFPAFFAELFDATVEKDGAQGGRHRVRLADDRLRSVPDAAAVARRARDAGPGRARRDRRRGRAAGVAAGTTKPSVAARERARATPQPFFGSAPSWVLTRLHARYGKETLSEDLVFREAKPAMGGRANWNGTNGDEGASVSQTADGGVNNFQGRYIIRHYWNGPVACENPRYDNWGGPPGNSFGGAAAARPRRGWRRRRAERSCSRRRCARRCRCSASRARRRRDGSSERRSDHQTRRRHVDRVRSSVSGNRGGGGGDGRGGAGARAGVLRLLRRGQRREADQQRDAGRADAQGQPHGAVDAEQLPGAARELRDGGAGAGRAAEGERQDAARRRVRRVDSLSAPRLVEYWEQDPCSPPRRVPRRRSAKRSAAAPAAAGAAKDRGPRRDDRGEVRRRRIRDRDPVGDGLDGPRHLAAPREVQHPAGRAEALAPYVRDKSKFFVAKVDIKKVKRDAQGVVQLSPLRFHYDANELRLPVRLGLLNAGGKQDLIVYVLHPTSRYEVANYTNTFIPTNLEVADGVRNNFAAFYAALFDATVEKMGRKVVVTEYAWQTTGCDPCPTPPLTADDLATLGLDVLEGIGVAVPPASPQRRPSPAPRRRCAAAAGRFFGGGPSGC